MRREHLLLISCVFLLFILSNTPTCTFCLCCICISRVEFDGEFESHVAVLSSRVFAFSERDDEVSPFWDQSVPFLLATSLKVEDRREGQLTLSSLILCAKSPGSWSYTLFP